MSDHESPIHLRKARATSDQGMRTAMNAPRCMEISVVVASFLSKRGQRLEHNAPISVGRPVQLAGGPRRIRGSF